MGTTKDVHKQKQAKTSYISIMHQKYLKSSVTFMQSMMNQLVSFYNVSDICAVVKLSQELLSDAII